MILIKISNSDDSKFVEIDESKLVSIAIVEFIKDILRLSEYYYEIRADSEFVDIYDTHKTSKQLIQTVKIDRNFSTINQLSQPSIEPNKEIIDPGVMVLNLRRTKASKIKNILVDHGGTDSKNKQGSIRTIDLIKEEHEYVSKIEIHPIYECSHPEHVTNTHGISTIYRISSNFGTELRQLRDIVIKKFLIEFLDFDNIHDEIIDFSYVGNTVLNISQDKLAICNVFYRMGLNIYKFNFALRQSQLRKK